MIWIWLVNKLRGEVLVNEEYDRFKKCLLAKLLRFNVEERERVEILDYFDTFVDGNVGIELV